MIVSICVTDVLLTRTPASSPLLVGHNMLQSTWLLWWQSVTLYLLMKTNCYMILTLKTMCYTLFTC